MSTDINPQQVQPPAPQEQQTPVRPPPMDPVMSFVLAVLFVAVIGGALYLSAAHPSLAVPMQTAATVGGLLLGGLGFAYSRRR
ncbi:hypothetical protein [Streptomyces sp. NPDC055005]